MTKPQHFNSDFQVENSIPGSLYGMLLMGNMWGGGGGGRYWTGFAGTFSSSAKPM